MIYAANSPVSAKPLVSHVSSFLPFPVFRRLSPVSAFVHELFAVCLFVDVTVDDLIVAPLILTVYKNLQAPAAPPRSPAAARSDVTDPPAVDIVDLLVPVHNITINLT